MPPETDTTSAEPTPERSIVVVSEETDALVESLTSYVEDTVSSLLGGSSGDAAPSTATTAVRPSPVEIHQIPSPADAAALKARASASAQRRTGIAAAAAASRDGGDGAAFFSCGDCSTYDIITAQQQAPPPMHAYGTNTRTTPSRAVTMEEPYFSDELSSVREMEALKRSVNDMQLTGSEAGVPPTAGAIAAVQPGRTLSNRSGRSRSLMTGKFSDVETDDLEIAPTKATTNTATAGQHQDHQHKPRHSRDESILFAAGPAEADLPPARPEPPDHERWAVAAPAVDLSGDWTIVADDRFRKEYNAYLANLGFGYVLRNVALTVIGSTTEHTRQSRGGRHLLVRGKNPRGVWERTLVASGYPDFDTHSDLTERVHYQHKKITVETADGEAVEAEAWWEEGGTVHRSWLRGGRRYGGGDFESYRYLEEGSDGQILVCRSIFHPNDKSKPRAEVLWRYRRDK